MKKRIATTLGCAALVLAACAAGIAGGASGPHLALTDSAQAAVAKTLGQGGEGGSVGGAGDRLGGLLSNIGAPILIAVAGWFLMGALASRNVGTGIGVVLVTIVGLIFLISPQSIEALAKGIANTVF